MTDSRSIDRAVLQIRWMGWALVIGLGAAGVYLFAREIPVLLREGVWFVVGDAAVRLVAMAIIGLVVYLPYGLAIAALKSTRRRAVFIILSGLIFVTQLALSVQAIFFGGSSTAAIGVVVMPFAFAIPVLVVWAIARLIGRGV